MGFASLAENSRKFRQDVRRRAEREAEKRELHRQLVYAAADAVYLAVYEGRQEDVDQALKDLRELTHPKAA